MRVTGDSPLPSPPLKPVFSSRYNDTQTQISLRDKCSYPRINDLRAAEESSSEQTFAPGLDTDLRLWRFSGPPTQMSRRASALSQWGSAQGTPDYQPSSIRDWEAELAVFRMSWYDERSLFDASGDDSHTEDGNKTRNPNIVDWDGPKDPENPLNWTNGKKWANIVTFSTITMIRQ